MTGFRDEARIAARKSLIENNKQRKQKKLDDYYANPLKCANDKCNGFLKYDQRKLKFCSISCSNKAFKRTNEDSIAKMKNTFAEKRKLKPPKTYDLVCNWCKMSFEGRTRNIKCCSQECKTSILSNAAKLSIERRLSQGLDVGWSSRSNIPSYPEQYMIDVFHKENINNWTREVRFGKWFADFCFDDIKLIIEIDGSQHWTDENRIKSDILKDDFLFNRGWQVIRIRWYKKESKNRLTMINDIKDVLQLIRELRK